jgi:hypothetical protein
MNLGCERASLLRGEGGDQIRYAHRQEHENDRRIKYWSSFKPKKPRARTVSIRHCDEKKHAGDCERYRADYNMAVHGNAYDWFVRMYQKALAQ